MLSPTDRARYARQLLLPEIGPAGQARLLTCKLAIPAPGSALEARAAEIAADYAQRAGLAIDDAGTVLKLPDEPALAALAGRVELHEAAAALCGALAAVEAIKQALTLGTEAAPPSALQLCAETAP